MLFPTKFTNLFKKIDKIKVNSNKILDKIIDINYITNCSFIRVLLK